MMPPWVLIDLSFLLHRAMHSVGELAYDGESTGVIFGFFDQLRMICEHEKVRSNRVAIFADSRESVRREEHAWYKAKRREERTEKEKAHRREIGRQADMLTKEILPAIGLPVYRQVGLESDDLIAAKAAWLSVCASWENDKARRAIIVTSDGDLFQSITRTVHWFDPQRNLYYDPKGFVQERGIRARSWGDVLALAGCHTDEVPGIPGVGKPTAIKYLCGGLPPKYKAHRNIVGPEGRKILERNRRIVCLPHRKIKPFHLFAPLWDGAEFFRVCKRLGFESMLRERRSWEAFFRGTLFRVRKRGEQ